MAEIIMLLVLIVSGGVVSDKGKEKERERLDKKYNRS